VGHLLLDFGQEPLVGLDLVCCHAIRKAVRRQRFARDIKRVTTRKTLNVVIMQCCVVLWEKPEHCRGAEMAAAVIIVSSEGYMCC